MPSLSQFNGVVTCRQAQTEKNFGLPEKNNSVTTAAAPKTEGRLLGLESFD
jgi:hypothetical protein